MTNHLKYVGRFAPSPSGPLHLGSLVTALGSYLQAKIHDGEWILRIDDIDTPRIAEGAIDQIQQSLISHGLHWDGNVVFQSARQQFYENTLEKLIAKNQAYQCECSRQEIKKAGAYYTGTCRNKTNVSQPYSYRFLNDQKVTSLQDELMGELQIDPTASSEDFVLKRRDGLIAYHLASVTDDIDMGVTQIVRGSDLITPTACQISLFSALGATRPSFIHLPIVCFDDGRKFSKQNHAPGLDNENAAGNLFSALTFLGFTPPEKLQNTDVQSIINWAIEHWSLTTIASKNAKQ